MRIADPLPKAERTAVDADGVSRVVDHLLAGPSLGVLPDRAGADEGRDLDRNPDPLRNLHHRTNVHLERARRAQRFDVEALVADLSGETFDVGHRPRTGARQPEVD